MAKKLRKAKAIGGVLVVRAKRSPSAMGLTKILSLLRLNIRLIHLRRSTSVAANTQHPSRRVTAATVRCNRLTQSARLRWRLLPVLLAAFAFPGCSDLIGTRAPKEPCPQISILRDAAKLTLFLDGTGRDLRDVRFQAQFGALAANCDIDEGRVEMRASIELIAARGLATNERIGQFAFFVALIDPTDIVLAKEVFHSPMEFQAKQQRSGIVEQIEQIFVLKPGERAAEYTVLVGFQLTRDQLEYNRRNSGR